MSNRAVLLFVIAAAVLGALSLVALQLSATAPVDFGEARLLPEFGDRADDAVTIEIQTNLSTLRLARGAGLWMLPDKTGIPARQEKVRALLLGLAELVSDDPKTTNPENYARIGVDDPEEPGSRATRVTVLDARGGQIASVLIGNQTAGRTRFVRVDGDERAWLAEVSFDASTEASLWMDKTLMRVDGDRVSSMVITHPSGEVVSISRADADQENFTVEPIPAGRSLRSPSIANPMTRALTNLTFEDVRSGDRPLDEASVTTVVYQTFDGLVVSLRIGNEDGKRWTTVTVSQAGAGADSGADGPPPDLGELSNRVANRQFELAGWSATNMTRHLGELLAPEDAGATPSGGQGLGPTLGPGG
jgi:uncharacterized protein DUF4340